MEIRKARLKDAPTIATYLLMAMQDIVLNFIGQKDPAKAKEFLWYFVKREDNQYSYQNCWVVEENNYIIAAANIYEGAELERLRAPIADYIRIYLKKPFDPEDETSAGEIYIDSLGVHPSKQGQGIGAAFLGHLIQYYVHQNDKILGLLVDKDNFNAKRLYLRLGFEPIGSKTLVGKHLLHLQIQPKSI